MFYKKKICYVLILACSIFLLTSCKGREKDSDNSSVVVFTINDSNVYLDEVLYRVWESEDENSYYSGNFSEQYGESYWDSDIIEGTTVSESLKEELYDDIVRDTLLYQKAAEEGYSLTEDEKELYKEEAENELDAMNSDVKKTIGATKELLISMKEKKAIVSKYFAELLDTYEVDEEAIRDSYQPEDYKQLDLQTIGFSKYTYAEDGTETAKSKEEDQMGLESLKEIAKEAKSVEDLNDLLTDDSDTLETEDLSVIPGDSACDEAIEEAALDMKPGDTSDIIETDEGYYIVKLLDNTSKDAYEETVSQAITQEKYKQFDEYFDTLKKDASIQSTDQWDSIKVGGTVIKE